MRQTAIVALIALAALWLLATGSAAAAASAQEGSLPGPDPSECQVEPRSAESIAALFVMPEATEEASPSPSPSASASPEGSPIAGAELPQGEPAGQDVLFGINATLREFVACFNATAPERALALVTNDIPRADLIVLGFQDPTAADQGTPAAGAGEPRPFLDIRDPRVLANGQVGVIVTDPSMPDRAFFYYFVEADGRWLISGAIETETGGAAGP